MCGARRVQTLHPATFDKGGHQLAAALILHTMTGIGKDDVLAVGQSARNVITE